MALPSGFLEELRARTPLSALIGRRVRLTRSGRHWKGCCPFHGEKTPSFYVYEDHFHCFGCGAHGDAISFVMQGQGASFIEAVEQLAAEAGMDVPKPTPEAAAADRLRRDLYSVLQEAAQIFQARLHAPEGRPALSYLRERGLTDETIARFGLGWSGEGRGALASEMVGRGIPLAMLVEVGLMRPAEPDRPAAEMFFSRVMFPIRDGRGRTISFGGRILGAGQPKYVNGPETELFSKRRTLFGLDLARSAAPRGADIVAVEGYMDVIALHQAGFAGAVAPLGTALTTEQLEELWRLSPCPVLCFDGDAAGARAAVRAVETALSLLATDRTLKIAKLEAGDDPDTLVRRGGPNEFKGILANADALVDALFRQCHEAGGDATPEQRASLRRRLEAAASCIGDRTLAIEYRRALLTKLYKPPIAATRREGTPPRRSQYKPFSRPMAPDASTAKIAAETRARILVAILLRHPDLLRDVEEAFSHLDLPPSLARLRHAILQWWEAATTLDSSALLTHLTGSGLAAEVAQTVSARPVPLPSCALADVMPAEAEAGWWHYFGLMDTGRLEQEVAAAGRDFDLVDEAAQRRLIALAEARNALHQGEHGRDPDQVVDMP